MSVVAAAAQRTYECSGVKSSERSSGSRTKGQVSRGREIDRGHQVMNFHQHIISGRLEPRTAPVPSTFAIDGFPFYLYDPLSISQRPPLNQDQSVICQRC